MSSTLNAPWLPSIKRYLIATSLGYLVLGAIGSATRGDPTGFLGVVFGFLWLGWIFVLVLLPVWLAFLWVFPRVGRHMAGPIALRGAIIGASVWLVAGALFFGFMVIGERWSPDSRPTVTSAVAGFVATALIGASLGMLEGRARAQRAARTRV